MPTLKQARAAIVARVKSHWGAAYPGVPLFYDNALPADAEVDQVDAYVVCEIRFDGGQQINLAPAPDHRTWGRVVFTAVVREGSGSSMALEYLDSLAGAMKFAQFGGIVTEAPAVGRPLTDEGWFSYDLSIPFRFDSNN